MKILVTGSTGFIGSHLLDLLLERGHDVRVLLRAQSSAGSLGERSVERVTGSFDDVDSLRAAVSGVDAVYHVAGVTAARDRAGYFSGNVAATRNLLEAVARFNPNVGRVVHVSSQAAAGPSVDADHPIDESAPRRPITTYGESKAAAEEEVERRMDLLPLTIVRPPAVYGQRDPEILRFFSVVARGFAPLIGFDRKKVSLVHVQDLVRGFVLAGESPVAVGRTYFISSEKFYTWPEVGEVTARVLGRKSIRSLRVPHAVVFVAGALSGMLGRFQAKPPVFNYEKARDITQRYWTCSVDRAVKEIGYHQEISLEEGVRRTVAWYREVGWMK